MESVSWDYCQQFIEQINQQLEHLIYLRFPIEAEWEYACRAGSKSAFSFGGKIDLDTSRANYSGKWDEYSAEGSTSAVQSYQPNAWGLFQMHGNVYEWCADWIGDYSGDLEVDPQGASSGHERVLRGGGWFDYGRSLRPASRLAFRPDGRYRHIGLRLARG